MMSPEHLEKNFSNGQTCFLVHSYLWGPITGQLQLVPQALPTTFLSTFTSDGFFISFCC